MTYFEMARLCQLAHPPYGGIPGAVKVGSLGAVAYVLSGTADFSLFDSTLSGGDKVDPVTVCFPGTFDDAGWLYDLKISWMRAPGGQGDVHKGFRECWDAVADQVLKLVAGNPVRLIGHSLGGGIAQQAADSFKQVVEIVTFGEPAGGNAEWAASQAKYRKTRFVFELDPVPWLPGRLPGYWHSCPATWFDGETWGPETYLQMARMFFEKFKRPWGFARHLCEFHAIENYVAALDNGTAPTEN